MSYVRQQDGHLDQEHDALFTMAGTVEVQLHHITLLTAYTVFVVCISGVLGINTALKL